MKERCCPVGCLANFPDVMMLKTRIEMANLTERERELFLFGKISSSVSLIPGTSEFSGIYALVSLNSSRKKVSFILLCRELINLNIYVMLCYVEFSNIPVAVLPNDWSMCSRLIDWLIDQFLVDRLIDWLISF